MSKSEHSGRDFAPHDRIGAPVVVVLNHEFVRRHFEGQDPIGRQILLPTDRQEIPATVVGVVSDSKYRTIGEDREAAMYEAYLQRPGPERRVHILLRTIQPPDTMTADVRDAILQIDSSAAVTVEPMTSALAFAFLPSRIGAALVGVLGALGALLAMVGLYGIISFAVSRRTAEIGIRMALGASPAAVMLLVLKDVVMLGGTGIIVGLVAAFIATRPLAGFLVAGLETSDPVSFAGTALLLGLTSLGAAWSPARRATRIQPASALRAE